MVAPAVPNLLGNVPVCFALDMADKAADAFEAGNETYAAVCLREACRRYLVAVAEYHGVRLPEHAKPREMFTTLQEAGVNVCYRFLDSIDAAEAVLDFEEPEDPIDQYIAIVTYFLSKMFPHNARQGGGL